MFTVLTIIILICLCLKIGEKKSWSSIALCCYPNANGAIRNLSLNTPTATIFLLFNYFKDNIWVRINAQFHFLHKFVVRVDMIHKTTNLSMPLFTFSVRPQKFWGRVEQFFQNGPGKYFSSYKLKQIFGYFELRFHN